MTFYKSKLAIISLLLIALMASVLKLWSNEPNVKPQIARVKNEGKATPTQQPLPPDHDKYTLLVSDQIKQGSLATGTFTTNGERSDDDGELALENESTLENCITLADYGLSDQYKALTDWKSSFGEGGVDISLDGKITVRKGLYEDFSVADLRQLIVNGTVEPSATKTLANKLLQEVYTALDSADQKKENAGNYLKLSQENIDKLAESRHFLYEAGVQGDISSLFELSNTFALEHILLNRDPNANESSENIKLLESNAVKYRELWSTLLKIESSATSLNTISDEEIQALKQEAVDAYTLARQIKGYSQFEVATPPPITEGAMPNICSQAAYPSQTSASEIN
ncbi:MAG: hypothetical protein ACI9WC_002881 [Arenicella sp.]|jgi:hypothetical protein